MKGLTCGLALVFSTSQAAYGIHIDTSQDKTSHKYAHHIFRPPFASLQLTHVSAWDQTSFVRESRG